MRDETVEYFNKHKWENFDVCRAQQIAHICVGLWELSKPEKVAEAHANIDEMTTVNQIAWYMFFATRRGLLIKSRMHLIAPNVSRPLYPKTPSPKPTYPAVEGTFDEDDGDHGFGPCHIEPSEPWERE